MTNEKNINKMSDTTDNQAVIHIMIIDMVTNEVLSTQISKKSVPSFMFNIEFDILVKEGENVMMTKWVQGDDFTTKIK